MAPSQIPSRGESERPLVPRVLVSRLPPHEIRKPRRLGRNARGGAAFAPCPESLGHRETGTRIKSKSNRISASLRSFSVAPRNKLSSLRPGSLGYRGAGIRNESRLNHFSVSPRHHPPPPPPPNKLPVLRPGSLGYWRDGDAESNQKLNRSSVSLPSPTCPLPPNKLSSLRNESLGYRRGGEYDKR